MANGPVPQSPDSFPTLQPRCVAVEDRARSVRPEFNEENEKDKTMISLPEFPEQPLLLRYQNSRDAEQESPIDRLALTMKGR